MPQDKTTKQMYRSDRRIFLISIVSYDLVAFLKRVTLFKKKRRETCANRITRQILLSAVAQNREDLQNSEDIQNEDTSIQRIDKNTRIYKNTGDLQKYKGSAADV